MLAAYTASCIIVFSWSLLIGVFGTVYKGTVTVYQTEDTCEIIDVAVKTINAGIAIQHTLFHVVKLIRKIEESFHSLAISFVKKLAKHLQI